MDDRHPGSTIGMSMDAGPMTSAGLEPGSPQGMFYQAGRHVAQTIEGRLSLMTPHLSASFRADTDQSGEWYVWTRLGERPSRAGSLSAGWATMQRCESRELAQRLADDLNQRSLRVAV